MPTGTNGQITVNPREVLVLAKALLSDLKQLHEKTEELTKAYVNLGDTYKDNGYIELGTYVEQIRKEILNRQQNIADIAKQLVIYAETLHKFTK